MYIKFINKIVEEEFMIIMVYSKVSGLNYINIFGSKDLFNVKLIIN